jgi:hypothetical protein
MQIIDLIAKQNLKEEEIRIKCSLNETKQIRSNWYFGTKCTLYF